MKGIIMSQEDFFDVIIVGGRIFGMLFCIP
jgi:hypothetical protein